MMPQRRFLLRLGEHVVAVAGAYLVAAGGANGAQECDAVSSSLAYPKVAQSIARWGEANGAVVSAPVRSQVLTTFCQAAAELARETVSSGELPHMVDDSLRSRLDNLSQQVVEEYLDREVDEKRQGRSLGAILRSALGAQGFSKPSPKRLVRVAVTYSREVDTLVAGSERFPRAQALLLPPGRIVLKGLRAGSAVCQSSFDLKPGIPAVFTC